MLSLTYEIPCYYNKNDKNQDGKCEKMIPLVKTYLAPKNEMMSAIEDILYSGYIAVGDSVNEFEVQFGNYIGNKNVVALNSGTAALHIALELIGIKAGDEVISTPMTSEATNTTIAITGAKIVWADVDPATGLLDPVSVESRITDKTKAIMVVVIWINLTNYLKNTIFQ